MRSTSPDPWKVLGISPHATRQEIRQAYLGLVRQHHPDQFPMGSAQSHWHENRLKEVTAAYQACLQQSTSAPPPPRYRRPTSPRPPMEWLCRDHGRVAVIYCTVCAMPLCSRCDTALSGYCRVHRPR